MTIRKLVNGQAFAKLTKKEKQGRLLAAAVLLLRYVYIHTGIDIFI